MATRRIERNDRETFFLSHGLLETSTDERSTPGERALRGMCPREVVESVLQNRLTVEQYESIMNQYSMRFHPIENPNRDHFLAFVRTTAWLPRAAVRYDDRAFNRFPERIRSMSAPELPKGEHLSFDLIR